MLASLVHASASLRFFCFFVRIRGCVWARGSILKCVGNAFLAGGPNHSFRFVRSGSGQSGRAHHRVAFGPVDKKRQQKQGKAQKCRNMQTHALTPLQMENTYGVSHGPLKADVTRIAKRKSWTSAKSAKSQKMQKCKICKNAKFAKRLTRNLESR